VVWYDQFACSALVYPSQKRSLQSRCQTHATLELDVRNKDNPTPNFVLSVMSTGIYTNLEPGSPAEKARPFAVIGGLTP
jgi:hypothetical protein